MNATDRKFVEDLIEQATSPCRDCRVARADAKKHETRRQRDALLAKPQADRLAALRGMTHAERVAMLGGVDLEIAIELVRDASADDQRMILGALPPAVTRHAVEWTIPLVQFYKVRTAHRMSGRTAKIVVTEDQRARLVACGFAPWVRSAAREPVWIGWDLSEQAWTWSAEQMAALLDVDKEIAELVATSRLVATPMSEPECRALMSRG